MFAQFTNDHAMKLLQVDFGIVNEFWHSELASIPDNQNKHRLRIDLGIDEKSGEHLYDLHDQRAQCGTARTLFNVFRTSAFARRLANATRTPKRPNGIKLGWRQFLKAKCDCIKERKPSECDCQDCTFAIENLRIWHRTRRGWFQKGRNHCGCIYHGGGYLDIKLELALDAEEAAWHAASAAAAEDSTYEAASAEFASAYALEAREAVKRRDTYEGMTRSVEALHQVLLPCGKVKLPEYTTTGATVFETYKRSCVYGCCERRVFRGEKVWCWCLELKADAFSKKQPTWLYHVRWTDSSSFCT